MPQDAATPKMTAQDLKWQAENDVRALVSAEEIRGDTKRHDRAMKEARSQMANLKKVRS